MSQPPSKKNIHFLIPREDYEDLLHVFPGNGELTAFFRSCAQWAIEIGPGGRIVEQIKRAVHKDEEAEWIG